MNTKPNSKKNSLYWLCGWFLIAILFVSFAMGAKKTSPDSKTPTKSKPAASTSSTAPDKSMGTSNEKKTPASTGDENESTPSPLSGPVADIKQLYDSGKYSIALEKSLNLLASKEDKLSPADGAALYYFVGMSYMKNNTTGIGVDYLKKVEKKSISSEYTKLAYLELVKALKDDSFQKTIYLEKVFERFPETPEALDAGIELGKEYLRLKNYRRALPVLESMVKTWKKGEEKPELYLFLAMGYSGVNNQVDASINLTEAEKKMGEELRKNPDYLFEAGKIYLKNNNSKKAAEYLELLYNVYPNFRDFYEATVLLAQAYELQGNPPLAAAFIMRALRKKPENKYLYMLDLQLARVLMAMSKEDQAKLKQVYPLVTTPEKLLNTVKNESPNLEERKMAAILLGQVYQKDNNLGKTVDNFYKYLSEKRDPVIEKMFKDSLDSYLLDLGNKKNYEGAFDTWMKVKNRKSYLSGDNLIKFGDILVKMKLFANAEGVFLHILKYRMYEQKWQEANLSMVRMTFKTLRFQDCLTYIGKLQSLQEPENSEINLYKYLSYRFLKKDAMALPTLEIATSQFATVSNAYQFRLMLEKILLLEQERKFDDALLICDTLTAFPDPFPEDKNQLFISTGNLYYWKSDLDKAIPFYQIAYQSGKDLTKTNKEWILYQLINIYKRKGNKAEADRLTTELRTLNPESFWVRQLDKFNR